MGKYNANGANVLGVNIPVYKSYSISDVGTAATHWLAGFYNAPAADVTLTIGGSVTQTYGTVEDCVAAHAFCVASGAGGTDLVLTVSGISITDAGVKNGADSEVIVADTDAASANQYFETSKKWLGRVTYTLTGAAGAFTFNYGFCKYEDFGNRDFTITDFEVTGHGGATETGLDIQLLKHSSSGWTYSAAAFVPGGTSIVDLNTDHGTDGNDLSNNMDFAYKRASLSEAISGSGSEGLVIRMDTAVNNSVTFATAHVGVIF